MVREYAQFLFSSIIPIIVLLIFIGFFIGLYIWTMNKKRTADFDRAGQLPLDDGDKDQNPDERGDK